jgi:hypothetical protein
MCLKNCRIGSTSCLWSFGLWDGKLFIVSFEFVKVYSYFLPRCFLQFLGNRISKLPSLFSLQICLRSLVQFYPASDANSIACVSEISDGSGYWALNLFVKPFLLLKYSKTIETKIPSPRIQDSDEGGLITTELKLIRTVPSPCVNQHLQCQE